MNSAATVLAAQPFWQRLAEIFTTPSLTLFLILGSAAFIIMLVVFTLTRWGQARPITTCVILSVIAHILLLGYAYATRLILQVPVAEPNLPMQVHLIADESNVPAEGNPSALADDPGASFDSPTAATELKSERISQFDSPSELTPELEPPTDAVPADPQLITVNAAMEPARFQLPVSETEIPTPNVDFTASNLDTAPSMEPQPIEFPRRGTGTDPQQFEPSADTPLEQPDISPELKNVDITPQLLDEAVLSDEELSEQFESELVVPDSQYSLAEQMSAATREVAPRSQAAPTAAAIDAAELIAAAASSVRLGDGNLMPRPYQYRSGVSRRALAKLRGGSDETEDAVEAALKWLANNQKSDGRWDPLETSAGREDKVYGHNRQGCGARADMGITALATLAFLGAGHTHLEGDYQANVQRALEFLVRHQAIDGDLSGGAKLFARMYCHSMSLLAISEAAAMTGDPRLQKPLRLGIGYSVQAQNKQDGGWRYQPGDRGDMSQFGWQVMAFHGAAHAGVAIEPATQSRMQGFLNSCRSGQHRGLASYRPGEGPSTTMTAEALVCNYFLDVPISGQAVDEALQRIISELPSNARTNLYYWYYATLAVNQSGGAAWPRWNSTMQNVLLSQQESSGAEAGSWPPVGLWAGYGGRVYSTALATLCLEVYYRYLPAKQGQSDPWSESARQDTPTRAR